MSLILKGIDLPKCSNEDCVIVIRKDKAVVKQTGYKEKTIEAIQIPEDNNIVQNLLRDIEYEVHKDEFDY